MERRRWLLHVARMMDGRRVPLPVASPDWLMGRVQSLLLGRIGNHWAGDLCRLDIIIDRTRLCVLI
jgi:hypothetical protein